MRVFVRKPDGAEVEIDLATAVEWIRSGELARDSPVLDPKSKKWRRADVIPILETAFEETSKETAEPVIRVSASAHEFLDLFFKLIFGAIAVAIPMALVAALLLLLVVAASKPGGSSLMVVLSALTLLVMTPYLGSVLFRRINEDAYSRAYGTALRRAGHTAEPVRTAITAFAIHRSRYQLLTSSAVLLGALLYYYAVRADRASGQFAVVFSLITVLLLIARGYILEWRIARGLFGANAYEARELIEFVLNKSRKGGNISGLGNQPLVLSEPQAIIIGHQDAGAPA